MYTTRHLRYSLLIFSAPQIAISNTFYILLITTVRIVSFTRKSGNTLNCTYNFHLLTSVLLDPVVSSIICLIFLCKMKQKRKEKLQLLRRQQLLRIFPQMGQNGWNSSWEKWQVPRIWTMHEVVLQEFSRFWKNPSVPVQMQRQQIIFSRFRNVYNFY